MISHCAHTKNNRMNNNPLCVFCGFEDCNYIFLCCLLPRINALYFSTLPHLLNLLTFLQSSWFILICPYLSWYPKEKTHLVGNFHVILPTSGKIPYYSFIETIVVEVTMHSRRKIKCCVVKFTDWNPYYQ